MRAVPEMDDSARLTNMSRVLCALSKADSRLEDSREKDASDTSQGRTQFTQMTALKSPGENDSRSASDYLAKHISESISESIRFRSMRVFFKDLPRSP